jgi:hypothetical protein
MMWNGFIWLRIGFIVGCFEHVGEPSDYLTGESLEQLEQLLASHRGLCYRELVFTEIFRV